MSTVNDNDVPDLSDIMPSKEGTLPARCCGRCLHAAIPVGPGGMLQFETRECHEGPPQVQFFPMPVTDRNGRPVAGQVQIMEHSGWPKTRAENVCGQFCPSNLKDMDS